MMMHAFKSFPHIVGMVDSLDEREQHVINIGFHRDTYHLSKQRVHHPLVSSVNIDQDKGHDSVMINIKST